MIKMYKSQDYINARLLDLDKRVTAICLHGTNLVPNKEDYSELYAIRREMIDVSDGENTIVFDKLGRPHICYVIPLGDRARADYYKDFLGAGTSQFWEEILPPFIGPNGKPWRYVAIGKYRPVNWNGRNWSIGLYGLPPAHSGGGFTVSYDGVNGECDRVNAASDFAGSYIHEIRWDEYGLLAVQMAKDGWEPHGNDAYGHYHADSSEQGARSPQCAYPWGRDSYGYPHTLTGTGPLSWRHNGKGTGIADMRGPVRIILSGVRTKEGRIEVIDFRKTGNNGTLTSSDLNMSSLKWKGITVKTGELAEPAATGQYFIDSVQAPEAVTASNWSHQINDRVVNRIPTYYSSIMLNDVKMAEGVEPCQLLRYLNYYKYETRTLQGRQYQRNSTGFAGVSLAGANWSNSSDGGAGSRGGNYESGYAYYGIGALLASEIDTLEG